MKRRDFCVFVFCQVIQKQSTGLVMLEIKHALTAYFLSNRPTSANQHRLMYVEVIARQIVTFWSTVYLAHIICLQYARQRTAPRDAARRTLYCIALRTRCERGFSDH